VTAPALPPLLVAISASGRPAVYTLASPLDDQDEASCRLCGARLEAFEALEQTCNTCLRRHQWKAA
jgi:hypothetical protein